jgi:hypothetical protein
VGLGPAIDDRMIMAASSAGETRVNSPRKDDESILHAEGEPLGAQPTLL